MELLGSVRWLIKKFAKDVEKVMQKIHIMMTIKLKTLLVCVACIVSHYAVVT